MPTLLYQLHTSGPLPVAAVGNKFARLHQAHTVAPVPDASCVPVAWLTEALGATRLGHLSQMFAELHATVGHDLTRFERELSYVLDGIDLTHGMRHALTTQAKLGSGPYAVRSSSTVEDGAHHSHAGLYASHLNLQGPDAIAAGIIACWRSFYSLRAILGRFRAGDVDPSPRMAVIVQRMIASRLAGVAFTAGNHILIEAVVGLGDTVVSGEADIRRHEYSATSPAPAPFDHVIALATTVQKLLGTDADIEWAYDGTTMHLLQARPVTAIASSQDTVSQPLFAWDSLYFATTLAQGVNLGGCAEVFHAMTTKRSTVYQMARRHGIHVEDGRIITFNAAGLATSSALPSWWFDSVSEVVVDLGTAARQNIIQATELADFLGRIANTGSDSYAPITAIIRPFSRGDSGAVSHLLEDGTVFFEHTAEGLLAINRGLAAPDVTHLPAAGQVRPESTVPEAWTADAVHQVVTFTAALSERYPNAYLEWVITNGVLQFVDFSIPHRDRPRTAVTAATTVLSPGTARGPLLSISDSPALTELSIAPVVNISDYAAVPIAPVIVDLFADIAALGAPPVIHARRPYAALSLLIGHVAGFLFDGGSTLCHLAILLREAGVPAVIRRHLPDLDAASSITITDGKVHITATPPTRAIHVPQPRQPAEGNKRPVTGPDRSARSGDPR